MFGLVPVVHVYFFVPASSLNCLCKRRREKRRLKIFPRNEFHLGTMAIIQTLRAAASAQPDWDVTSLVQKFLALHIEMNTLPAASVM